MMPERDEAKMTNHPARDGCASLAGLGCLFLYALAGAILVAAVVGVML